tara:strand:- start:960 stop:1382 length:423 start_codon:yes stop_codon:yes gene_type:complete
VKRIVVWGEYYNCIVVTYNIFSFTPIPRHPASLDVGSLFPDIKYVLNGMGGSTPRPELTALDLQALFYYIQFHSIVGEKSTVTAFDLNEIERIRAEALEDPTTDPNPEPEPDPEPEPEPQPEVVGNLEIHGEKFLIVRGI